MAKLRTDRLHWAWRVKLVTRRTRGYGDVEDLLHSAFVRREGYGDEHEARNPGTFLVRTAANFAIDAHRQDRLWEFNFDDEGARCLDEAPQQDEALAAGERLVRVNEGLARRPARSREVFLLHRLEGIKYRERAARCGISQSAGDRGSCRFQRVRRSHGSFV